MISEEVVNKLRALPLEQQQKVMELVNELTARSLGTPRKSLKGAMSDLRVDLTEEDFDEVRTQVWTGFPRDVA